MRPETEPRRRPPHPPSMDALLKAGPAAEHPGPLRPRGRQGGAAAGDGRRGDPARRRSGTAAAAGLARRFAPTLVRAINAHRRPAPHEPRTGSAAGRRRARRILEVAAGYATVEYDPARGARGKRQDHVRALARDLFACGDAIAVNNNAAAVLLALAALARGRSVLVSRGELVAIGGSFKIPEILEASGARLREVGTTNRTTAEDYREALSPRRSRCILSVHPSNYEIRGYTRPPGAARARRARARGRRPVAARPRHRGGRAARRVRRARRADRRGVPGRRARTSSRSPATSSSRARRRDSSSAARSSSARAAAHPVARAVRPDKLTLAALAATLAAWKTGAWRQFPIYRAAGARLEELEERGARILRDAAPRGAKPARRSCAPQAAFGGGTSPEKLFPSRALALSHRDAVGRTRSPARLRSGRPPDRRPGRGRPRPARPALDPARRGRCSSRPRSPSCADRAVR